MASSNSNTENICHFGGLASKHSSILGNYLEPPLPNTETEMDPLLSLTGWPAWWARDRGWACLSRRWSAQESLPADHSCGLIQLPFALLVLACFLSLKKIFYLFIFRARGREEEKH